MVSVMYSYNMYMEGLFSTLTLGSAFLHFCITFVVAFLCESVIGPIARGVASKMPIDKSKKAYVILANSTCMVIGMVMIMSFYGLITAVLSNGVEGPLLKQYVQMIIRNVIVAYPAQLLVVGPLVRWVFGTFIKNKTSKQLA